MENYRSAPGGSGTGRRCRCPPRNDTRAVLADGVDEIIVQAVAPADIDDAAVGVQDVDAAAVGPGPDGAVAGGQDGADDVVGQAVDRRVDARPGRPATGAGRRRKCRTRWRRRGFGRWTRCACRAAPASGRKPRNGRSGSEPDRRRPCRSTCCRPGPERPSGSISTGRP